MLFAYLLVALLAALEAQPPAANRVEFREALHGTELLDHYHWLENFDDPAAKSWIAAQDRFASSILEKLPGQEKLRARMLELAATERITVPLRAGNRFFYQRSTPSSPHPLECYRDGVTGAEKIWLDPAEVPKDSGITRMRIGVSPDGKLAAYTVRTAGQDEVEIRFRDVDTGRDLPDKLPKALYSRVTFLPGRSGVFYGVRSRDTGARIRLYKFGGESPGRDVFGEGLDARVFLSADVSRDGRWLTIQAQRGWAGADLYVKDLKVDGPVRRSTDGLDAQFVTTRCGPDRLLVVTTWKAPRKRAMLVNLGRPEPANWREVVPQSADVLESTSCVGGRIYAHYLHDVQTRIRVFSLDGKALAEVPIPSGATGGVSGDWEHEDGFLSYETLVTPFRVDLWFRARI